jgi:inosose dehydratase
MNNRTSSSDLLQLGAQSFSFREFDFAGSLDCLKKLELTAMEFCGVHFPADAQDAALDDVMAQLKQAGISTPVFGVEAFSADHDANRAKFEFAKKLGVGILSAYPELDAFDSLEKLVEEFQIKIAIHNHGPESLYSKVADTLDAVDKLHPFIGACVDTGHALRSGEAPHEVIEALGDRVISVHLKDWTVGGEEQILGEGDMDVTATVQALKAIGFQGPIMMEYELSPDNPVADMRQGLACWRAAAAKA